MKPNHITPYPEVNVVLNELLPDVQEILGNQFIGMYLHRSLAGGDFDQSSNIGFAAVSAEELPDKALAALEACMLILPDTVKLM